MRWIGITTIIASTALTAGLSAGAVAAQTVEAELRGFEEVPPISTPATGEFRGAIGEDELEFELSYADLEGSVREAHIHFGQPRVNGGVMVFFCGGGGQPACPASTSGTISGTIEPSNVVGPTGQGVDEGEFDAVLRAIGAGAAYANVHNTRFPGGEIRGQIVERNSRPLRPFDD